jgi:hypothetical protein
MVFSIPLLLSKASGRKARNVAATPGVGRCALQPDFRRQGEIRSEGERKPQRRTLAARSGAVQLPGIADPLQRFVFTQLRIENRYALFLELR